MTNLSTLEQKWWYRLVKVMYVLLIVLVVVFEIWALNPSNKFETLNFQKSSIDCEGSGTISIAQFAATEGQYKRITSNNNIALDSSPTGFWWALSMGAKPDVTDPTSAVYDDLYNYCYHLENPSSSKDFRVAAMFYDPNFTVNLKMEGNTIVRAKSILIWVLSTLIIFEVVRRVFYYIALGRFFPSKK